MQLYKIDTVNQDAYVVADSYNRALVLFNKGIISGQSTSRNYHKVANYNDIEEVDFIADYSKNVDGDKIYANNFTEEKVIIIRDKYKDDFDDCIDFD